MIQKLKEFAEKAMSKAYAPYSGFLVGAALLSEDDQIFSGCNIENKSLTPTVCAERTAIFKAISEGVLNFKAIGIITRDDKFTAPCGVCRQVMSEFVDDNFKIILFNNKGESEKYDFGYFFNGRFEPNSKIGNNQKN